LSDDKWRGIVYGHRNGRRQAGISQSASLRGPSRGRESPRRLDAPAGKHEARRRSQGLWLGEQGAALLFFYAEHPAPPGLCPKKKPRRNGAKSNGRKYPNGGMVLLPESEASCKVVISRIRTLRRPCCSAATSINGSRREPTARAHVDDLTLDGTASPSFPFRPADFAPASPCGRGLFLGKRGAIARMERAKSGMGQFIRKATPACRCAPCGLLGVKATTRTGS